MPADVTAKSKTKPAVSARVGAATTGATIAGRTHRPEYGSQTGAALGRYVAHAPRSAGQSGERWTAGSLHLLTLALALLAAVIYVLTDADGRRQERALWFQVIAETCITLGAAWLIRKRLSRSEVSLPVVPLLLLIFVFSLIWEPVHRLLFGSGRPFETIVMHAQKNLMLAMAIVGIRVSFQRISVVIGVSLSIFCAAICHENRILMLIALYGFAAVSWLVASYWDSLRARLISGETRRLPWRWLLIGPAVPLLLLLASANGGSSTVTALKGFLPGSGGTGDSDPFSRGGINDGDALVAGADNIKSFGPIEDAPFAEDDKPSLYDVFNDTFDEPVRKIKDQDRSVALPPEMMANIDARMAKSQQASREFSTNRQSGKKDNRAIRDLDSNALLYVAGRVPLHLRMQIYDVFDGIDWYPEPPCDHLHGLHIVQIKDKPWLRLSTGSRGLGLHVYRDTHAIKVINLKSAAIPAPLDLCGLHIDLVDQVDMFGWQCESIVRMNRRFLPELTSIQIVSDCMDQSLLPEHHDLVFATHSEGARRQLPELPAMQDIHALAEHWTKDVPQGYKQIAAVIQRLRSDYVLDRKIHANADSRFPVGEFLFESRRGPEYQFATAATLLLRSLGYSTRLVSGFYARPEKHDASKHHTPVHAADAHFWCEVFVGGGTWVTLEPSPGYEVLSPPPGFARRAWMLVLSIGECLLRHWMLVAIVAGVVLILFVWRREIQDFILTLHWKMRPSTAPRRRVIQTVALLERRLRLAGSPRPSGITFSRWIAQHPRLSAISSTTRAFTDLANRAVFDRGDDFWLSCSELTTACCERIDRDVSLKAVRRKNSTTKQTVLN